MACFSVEVLINEVQEKLVSIGHFIYYLLFAQEVFSYFYISVYMDETSWIYSMIILFLTWSSADCWAELRIRDRPDSDPTLNRKTDAEPTRW